MIASSATDKLTERERECLRLWLEHKTAKEIALDLGISHYAVEKRLKMARTKLDVPTSLEAARMLAEVEGYGRTVAQSADLPSGAGEKQHSGHKSSRSGVFIMSISALAIIAAIAVANPFASHDRDTAIQTSADSNEDGRVSQDENLTQGGSQPASDGLNPVAARGVQAETHVEGSPDEVQTYAENQFAELDSDSSGYIDQGEAPALMIQFTSATWEGEGSPPDGWLEQQEFNRVPLSPEMARAAYISQGDSNADGKLSRDEYFALHEAGFDANLIPAAWREEQQSGR